MQDQYFKEKCWSINGILSYLEKKNEIFYVEYYSRYLATCVFWAKFYHSIFMKYQISNLIYLYAVKKNYPKTYMNVEYAYGNIREQVVWHLWSFTFFICHKFLRQPIKNSWCALSSLCRTCKEQEQQYLVFTKALAKKWIYNIWYSIPLLRKQI